MAILNAQSHEETRPAFRAPQERRSGFSEYHPGDADYHDFSKKLLGGHTIVDQGYGGVIHQAQQAWDYAKELIYGRTWVIPETIDAGFVIELLTYSISIWNADEQSTKNITDITIDVPDGLDLNYDALPIMLPPTAENIQTLYVFKDGPPTQNTTITYTVGSELFTVKITGIRVIPLAYEPNWDNGVQVSLIFKSVMAKSKRFVEQRRPLQPKGLRSSKFTLLEKDIRAQLLSNDLHYASNKIMGVPIFTEPMHAITSLTGNQIVTIQEDLSTYWHLKNLTTFVLLIDYASGTFELKEVMDITGQNVTFRVPVAETFTDNTSIIYPVFLGIVNDISTKMITDDTMEMELDFREIKVSSG